jgi:hypothetical protein
MISSFLAISDPIIKLQKLFDHLKKYFGLKSLFFPDSYTRQQIATLTVFSGNRDQIHQKNAGTKACQAGQY